MNDIIKDNNFFKAVDNIIKEHKQDADSFEYMTYLIAFQLSCVLKGETIADNETETKEFNKLQNLIKHYAQHNSEFFKD